MNLIEDRVFLGQRVRLDYTSYRNCVFQNCEIVVNLGDFDLDGCEFTGCSLHLGGFASAVAKIMYMFYPDKIPLIFKEGEKSPLAEECLKDESVEPS